MSETVSPLRGSRLALARPIAGAAVFARRQVRQPIEGGCQVTLGGKSAAERDVGDRDARVEQERLRTLDAPSEHVLVRRQAGAPLERSNEEIEVHVQLLRQLVQREVP